MARAVDSWALGSSFLVSRWRCFHLVLLGLLHRVFGWLYLGFSVDAVRHCSGDLLCFRLSWGGIHGAFKGMIFTLRKLLAWDLVFLGYGVLDSRLPFSDLEVLWCYSRRFKGVMRGQAFCLLFSLGFLDFVHMGLSLILGIRWFVSPGWWCFFSVFWVYTHCCWVFGFGQVFSDEGFRWC